MTKMSFKQIKEIAKSANAKDLTNSSVLPPIEPVMYSVGIYGVNAILAVGCGDDNWYIIKRSSNLFKLL